MDKMKFNYGLAIFALAAIFAVFLIAVLNPEDLSVQGALVIGALIAWGGQIITFFFRKSPEDKDKEITALKNMIKKLTKEAGNDTNNG